MLLQILIIAMSALGGMSTDIYISGLPKMAASLHVSMHLVQTTITAFFLGLSLGQLIIGPASDRFGRRPVILTGLTVYILGTLFCIFSGNIYLIIFGRILQSFGACAGIVTAYAVIRDLFEGEKSTQLMAQITTALGIAAIISPTLGGYLQAWFNWRSSFILLGLLSSLMLLGIFFKLPESIKVLQKDALSIKKMFRNYLQLLSLPTYISYNLSVALAYPTFMIFLVAAPIFFIKGLHLNTQQFGLLYAVAGGTFALGGLFVKSYAVKFSKEKLLNYGFLTLLLGSILMILFSKLVLPSVTTFMVPFLIIMLGLAIVYSVGIAAAMQACSEIAGTAAALLNFTRFITASFVGFLVSYLGIHQQWGLGIFMLILVILSMTAAFFSKT